MDSLRDVNLNSSRNSPHLPNNTSASVGLSLSKNSALETRLAEDHRSYFFLDCFSKKMEGEVFLYREDGKSTLTPS